jgi:hypothetical protein
MRNILIILLIFIIIVVIIISVLSVIYTWVQRLRLLHPFGFSLTVISQVIKGNCVQVVGYVDTQTKVRLKCLIMVRH